VHGELIGPHVRQLPGRNKLAGVAMPSAWCGRAWLYACTQAVIAACAVIAHGLQTAVAREQTGAPRMSRAIHKAERVAEPLPLRLGEHRQRRGKVSLVFGPPVLGLIEQLDLRGEVGNAADVTNPMLVMGRRMRSSRRDTQSLPEDSSSMTWIRHDSPGPGPHQMSCTPAGSRSPGGQGRRLPGGSAACHCQPGNACCTASWSRRSIKTSMSAWSRTGRPIASSMA
jgi:hypothetical protein